MRPSLTENDVFGEFIELGTLAQLDAELGVNGTTVLALDVLGPDVADLGEPVLGEQLGDLSNKGNALTHAFDLNAAMLFEDELAQKQPLVESRVAADPKDVCLIEFGVFLIHCASTCLSI